MSDNGFDDLIKAFKIFRKYGNPKWPTGCEHDTLYVYINPEEVSEEDKEKLDNLGFAPAISITTAFRSFRFGSA